MAWTERDIPDLTGKVAVVTGAGSGLGRETTRALAAAGARVVMATRDAARAYATAAEVAERHPGASLSIVPVDLASLDSIRTAAATILTTQERVDLLVNSAGVMAVPWQRTADGFEMQIGVNHLGHFALTALLLPGLLRSPAARVVTVSSVAHHIGRSGGRPRPGHYHPWTAYGRSKLANFHFGLGLHKVFADAGVPCASLVADPGLAVTGTGLRAHGTGAGTSGAGRRSRRLLIAVAARLGTTSGRAALPQIRAATDPRARSGDYYAPLLVAGGPPVRRPILRRIGLDHAIRRLWTVSEHATGLALSPAAVRRLVRV